MKVLIADKLADVTVKQLESLGANVSMQPDLSADDLPDALGDSEVLVVRSTKVTRTAIEAASSLSLIIRAGAGVNTIDLECASSHGIYVTNCPGKNTAAVAELAIGLIIAADRNIVNASYDLRDGKWRKKVYSSKSNGLKGRTLGIIGFGSIGKAVAERAKGLDMHVAAWSRSLTAESAKALGIEYSDSIEKIAEISDAITVHLASTPQTKHMLNKEIFDRMKDTAIFVNTSRGEVVDTEALTTAIQEKDLRVGLDVYENEPTAGLSEFKAVDVAAAVTCTPHIGASTKQAAEAIADEVVNIVKAYRDTGTPLNVVNLQKQSPAVNKLVVRHFNKVGVLAGVLDELRGANINIEEMQNIIFDGGSAASCTLRLDDSVSAVLLEKLTGMDNIIQITEA